jgi:hypothetical protein
MFHCLSARHTPGNFFFEAINKVPLCSALGAMLRCSYAKYAYVKVLDFMGNLTIGRASSERKACRRFKPDGAGRAA